MLGKISRLPAAIRDQVNQRLANGQPGAVLLPWLNSLPEVQALLAQHFDGQSITDQNLTEYRQHSFRRWEMRQAALEFAAEEAACLSNPCPAASAESTSQPTPGPLPRRLVSPQSDEGGSPTEAGLPRRLVSPESHEGGSPTEAGPSLVDHLVHWIAIRFAAAAQTAPIPDDPEANLREIRSFLGDIVALRRGDLVALRRGDLVARRLGLEQQRLALEQSKTEPELENRFWEWTQRPDIQAKLYPNRDPDKTRLDVVRILDHHLFGSKTIEDLHDPDPACLI